MAQGIDTETLIACLWSPSLLAGDGLKLSASVPDLSGSGWAPLPPPGDIRVGNCDPRVLARTLRGQQSAHLPTSGKAKAKAGDQACKDRGLPPFACRLNLVPPRGLMAY
jgi:hypothetical protein